MSFPLKHNQDTQKKKSRLKQFKSSKFLLKTIGFQNHPPHPPLLTEIWQYRGFIKQKKIQPYVKKHRTAVTLERSS